MSQANLSPYLQAAWHGKHFLRCKHAIGSNSVTRYLMYCNFIKSMPDGRLKICVFGERYNSGAEKSYIRYVPARRVLTVDKTSGETT